MDSFNSRLLPDFEAYVNLTCAPVFEYLGFARFVTIFKSCQPWLPPPFELNSSTHIFPLTLFVSNSTVKNKKAASKLYWLNKFL